MTIHAMIQLTTVEAYAPCLTDQSNVTAPNPTAQSKSKLQSSEGAILQTLLAIVNIDLTASGLINSNKMPRVSVM